MNIRTLFQYKPIIKDCQDFNNMWIDYTNSIHFINHDNSHYTYLKENIYQVVTYEQPLIENWIKVFSGKFKVEVTGKIERIFETRKLWFPLIIKRLSECDIFELEILETNKEGNTNKKYLLNLPKDNQKFFKLF